MLKSKSELFISKLVDENQLTTKGNDERINFL